MTERSEQVGRHGRGVPHRRDALRRGTAWLLVTVLTVVAACFLTTSWDHQHHAVSPIDEFQYLDYLNRTAHGHLLHDGQLIQQPTLQTVSCRGIGLPGYTPPPCGPGPFNPLVYPNLGYNVGTHTPLYFLIDGPVARVLYAAGADSDFLDAGRLLSGVWLGVALAIFLYALRLMRLSWPLSLVLAGLLATSPTVVEQCAIVSPDATLPLSGALVLLGVLLWSKGTWRTWHLAVLGVFIGLLNERNLLIALAMGLTLVLLPGGEHRAPTLRLGRLRRAIRPGLLAGAVLVVTDLVGTEGWLVVRALTAVHQGHGNPLEAVQHATSLSLVQITGSARDLLPILGRIGDASSEGTNQQNIYFLLNLAVIAAVGAAALRRRVGALSVESAIARGGAAALVIGGPLLVVLVFVVSHAYFALPLRYNICLIPALLAAAGDSCRSRATTAGVVAVSALAMALTVNVLVTTPFG